MIDAIIKVYRGITESSNRLLFRALGELYVDLEDRFTAIESRLSALEPTAPPIPAQTPSEPTTGFRDDFNYLVERNRQPSGNTDNPFVGHGWDLAKATNISGSHLGNLYTDNGRLVIESLASSGQSDFYLHKSGPFPARLQIEFEIDNRANIGSSKLIYPSPDGNYPVPGDSYPVLVDVRQNNFGWTGDPALDVNGEPGDLFLMIEGSGMHWDKTAGDGPWKMMHTNPVPIPRATRTQVRIIIDTVNRGIFASIRPLGQDWVEVIHAVDGEDVMGYRWTWNIEPTQMQSIRIPTTMNDPGTMYLHYIQFSEAV